MTRFPSLTEDQWTPAQRRVAQEIMSGPRGQLRGPFMPLLHSPELASHVQRLGEHLRFKTALSDALLEIAILVTARRYRCPNIWQSHRALALKAGLDPAVIADLAHERRPASLSDTQAEVYDFSSELTRDIGVSDDTYNRFVSRWGQATAIDLVAVCGYYVLLAMVLNTAKVPLGEGVVPFEP